jgi:hypothetical protein
MALSSAAEVTFGIAESDVARFEVSRHIKWRAMGYRAK